jgi:hypothetical protein
MCSHRAILSAAPEHCCPCPDVRGRGCRQVGASMEIGTGNGGYGHSPRLTVRMRPPFTSEASNE